MAEEKKKKQACFVLPMHELQRTGSQSAFSTALTNMREVLPCWPRPASQLLQYPTPDCDSNIHFKKRLAFFTTIT